jgi:regulatory protein
MDDSLPAAAAADAMPLPGRPVGDEPASRLEDAAPLPPQIVEDERALRLAYDALGRRERTVAELRTVLERKRVDPSAIEAVVDELRATGWLDDARYARRFADDKRQLDRWGSERIARDLRKRGVAAELVEEVVAGQGDSEELATALLLLEQRLPTPPTDDRERSRAWRLLIRRGYDAELAYEAVHRYACGGGEPHAA